MHSFRKHFIFTTSYLLLFAITVSAYSCIHSNRKFYKTHTGKVITVLDNYIILEKYKGKKPPKNNYIKLFGDYGGGDIRLFFKENDSILIFRRGDENSIDIVLDQNKYNIKTFYNTWEEIQEFKKKISFSDPHVKYEFSYSSYDKYVTVSECMDDVVYIRHYGCPPFYHESVYSRYDQELNQLYQQY